PAGGPPPARGPEVIARSVPVGSAAAAAPGRPPAATPDRPRPVGASPAPGLPLTTFPPTSPPRPGLVPPRLAPHPHPTPSGPGAGAPPPPGFGVPPPAPPFGAVPPPAPPFGPPSGFAVAAPDDTWQDTNCFGCGDGVVNDFNNLFFFNSEYLLWWLRGNRVPPLVTASSVNPLTAGMVLGLGTEVVFGGSSEGRDTHSGFRLRGGFWLDRDHTLGLEASYFFLDQQSRNFFVGSAGVPVLAVPFLDTSSGGSQSAFIFALPGEPGSARATLMTRLWGAEANLRGNLWDGPCGHIDLIGGFRALGLDDNFLFGVASVVPPPAAGGEPVTVVANDPFATRTRSYGAQCAVTASHP